MTSVESVTSALLEIGRAGAGWMCLGVRFFQSLLSFNLVAFVFFFTRSCWWQNLKNLCDFMTPSTSSSWLGCLWYMFFVGYWPSLPGLLAGFKRHQAIGFGSIRVFWVSFLKHSSHLFWPPLSKMKETSQKLLKRCCLRKKSFKKTFLT